MISILSPKVGETIYDPASGSCGFLVECFEYMLANTKTPNQRRTLQERTFYANEKKRVPALMGLINMFLHGIRSPNVRRRNTLDGPTAASTEQFDIVLTNPPFGGVENRATQMKFPVRARATELLFLQRIFQQLSKSKTSRCGIVVPDGFLFRLGAFADVKRRLMEEFNLSMVVSLPSGTFAPYSDVKTAILFFGRRGPTKETLFLSVPAPDSNVGKFSTTRSISDADFVEALAAWKAWRSSRSKKLLSLPIFGNCEIISAKDIIARGFDLSRPELGKVEHFDAPPEILSDLIIRVDRVKVALSRLQTLVSENAR